MKEEIFEFCPQKKTFPVELSHELPFVFSVAYSSYLANAGDKVCIYQGKTGELIPFCFRNRHIKTIYIVYPPILNGQRLDPLMEQIVFESFIAFIGTKIKFQNITHHVPLDVFYASPVHAASAPFGNVKINLAGVSENEIFNSFQSSNRNIIRKAIKEGAYVKFGNETFDDFYEIYSQTLKRQNLSFDAKSTVFTLYEALEGKCLCGVVYNPNGTPEGSVLVPFSTYGGFSYFAGSSERQLIRGAVKLLHWEVVKELKKMNVNCFVLGGVRINEGMSSKYKGLFDFKMSFGSELTEGLLWKVEKRSLKLILYRFAVRVKLLLEGNKNSLDIIDQVSKFNSSKI